MEAEHRKKQNRVRRSREEITQILDRYQASGQSAQAFCQAEGLKVGNFSRWRRQYEPQQDASCLRAVKLTGAQGLDGVVVRSPRGVEVLMPDGVDVSQIAALVEALGRVRPC